MLRNLIIGFVLLLAWCLPVEVSAHQQKTALTRILFNSNTGNIEVMHRFYLHDADHAASVVFNNNLGLTDSQETRELFASYVRSRFAVDSVDENGDINNLPLRYVGEEIDGQFLWVYQEIEKPGDIQGLEVVDIILRDVWPAQSNLVNVEKAGEIYSMVFTGESEFLAVKF